MRPRAAQLLTILVASALLVASLLTRGSAGTDAKDARGEKANGTTLRFANGNVTYFLRRDSSRGGDGGDENSSLRNVTDVSLLDSYVTVTQENGTVIVIPREHVRVIWGMPAEASAAAKPALQLPAEKP